jgi:enoyl-CoA hydratase/carnithine racemase
MQLKTDKIIATVEGGIGWITFNNPERRNAISIEMWEGVGDALEAFQADPAVRLVVLKGAGGKAFVSGADISQFAKVRDNAEQAKEYARITDRGRKWLVDFNKPLIAMIQGACIGGGLAIALSADIRFAAKGSRMGIPAAKLGLGYAYDGLANLARLVGPSNAKDIMFTGRFLDTAEALRIGLINFETEEADLEQKVRDYAAIIAGNAPLTIRAAKATVQAYEDYSDAMVTPQVNALIDACFNSEDYKEGRAAFGEKRKPQFKGR